MVSVRFLDEVIAEAPNGVLDPLPGEWDVPRAGVAGEYLLVYFGFYQPRYRNVSLAEGEWAVDVIDAWNMTVESVPDTFRVEVRIELPGRQYMAARLRRVG